MGLAKRFRPARAVAWTQRGLITTEQLAEAGAVNPAHVARMVERGWLVRVHRGVYRLGDSKQTAWQQVQAAVLREPAGVLGFDTAAWIWKFGEECAVVHLCGPASRSAPGLVVHEVPEPHPADVVVKEGFRVTSPERTLVDLAGSLEEEPLMTAVESAWQLGLIEPRELLPWLDAVEVRNRRGLQCLRRLLKGCLRRGAAMESPLEVRFLRAVEAHGLPRPEVQVWFDDEWGRFRGDFCWVRERLVVETQGRKYHLTPEGFEASAERTARLAALGFTMVVVTWEMLRTPQWAIRLRAALEAHNGLPAPEPVIYDKEPVPLEVLRSMWRALPPQVPRTSRALM